MESAADVGEEDNGCSEDMSGDGDGDETVALDTRVTGGGW